MTSPLTDNYKKLEQKLEECILSFDGASDIGLSKLVRTTHNGAYLAALKSMVEVVESKKLESDLYSRTWRAGWHTALDTLKAEIERAISEIANNN